MQVDMHIYLLYWLFLESKYKNNIKEWLYDTIDYEYNNDINNPIVRVRAIVKKIILL